MNKYKPVIIADSFIPYLKGLLDDVADMTYLPPAGFTPDAVKNADALIIRTRCKCNKELLCGSKVRFIATATIGCDHIDDEYCKAAGIEWKNAPGCNANSVANYIYLALEHALTHGVKAKTIGVVGVGNVGKKVVKAAAAIGLRVLENDPPRQATEQGGGFCDLSEVQREADIITFHVPLKDDTYHLCDETFLAACRKKPLIINSARGEVCDNSALEKAGNRIILDCWENEPLINRKLLDKALIATPHIAGYSADGKAMGTYMAAKAICGFFGIDKQFRVTPPESNEDYDIMRDDKALREDPSKFEWLRNHYPLRRDKYDF